MLEVAIHPWPGYSEFGPLTSSVQAHSGAGLFRDVVAQDGIVVPAGSGVGGIVFEGDWL